MDYGGVYLQVKGLFFVFLLLSHEALVLNGMRQAQFPLGATGHASSAVDTSSSRNATRLDAFRTMDAFYDNRLMKYISDQLSGEEFASHGSLMEIYANMQALKPHEKAKINADTLAEAEDQAEFVAQEAAVENLNVFLCRRGSIQGYDGMLSRKLDEDARFEIRCSIKVNLLNRAVVGKSLTSEDENAMIAGIDSLKRLTFHGPARFPIKLKMCESPDGCGNDHRGLQSEGDDLFSGKARDDIPVPAAAKDMLMRPGHNPSHLYAVCYDKQDDCNGAVWLPKDLRSCNGWLRAKDARITLGQLRDAVKTRGWQRFWARKKSHHKRVSKSLSVDLSKRSHTESKEDRGEKSMTHSNQGYASVSGDVCLLKEWRDKKVEDDREDLKEILSELSKHCAHVGSCSADERKISERICEEAEYEGELVCSSFDCHTKFAPPALYDLKTHCLSLVHECREKLHVKCKPKHCPMTDLRDADAELEHSGSVLLNRSSLGEVSSILQGRRHRRPIFQGRRRRRNLGKDLLAPKQYQDYSPYVYVSGRNLLEAGLEVGEVALDLGGDELIGAALDGVVRGLAWTGDVLSDVGGSGGWFSGFGGGGDGGGDDAGAVAVFFVVVLLISVIAITLGYCLGNEERCKTSWYRGRRLRKKMKKWTVFWNAVENEVYLKRRGYLFFDAQIDVSGNDCLKSIQWGRRWVERNDTLWVNAGKQDFGHFGIASVDG